MMRPQLLTLALAICLSSCTWSLDYESNEAEQGLDFSQVSLASLDLYEDGEAEDTIPKKSKVEDDDRAPMDVMEDEVEAIPPHCGDQQVAPDEACDAGPEGSWGCSEDCLPLPSYICFGEPSFCRVPLLNGTLDEGREINLSLSSLDPNRPSPDAIAYLVSHWREDLISLYQNDPIVAGLEEDDEVLLYQAIAKPGGWYHSARVRSVSFAGIQVDIDLEQAIEEGYDPSYDLIIQRVPHFRSLHLSEGAKLVSGTADLLDPNRVNGRTTGIIAFRVAGELVLSEGAAIQADQGGFQGGSPQSAPYRPQGLSFEGSADGSPGRASREGASGGDGGGTESLGGFGSEGLSCDCEGGQAGAGRRGGGGAGARCQEGLKCSCPSNCEDLTWASGAGGGAPPTWDSPEAGCDLLQGALCLGAGGAQGGGGGAAGGPLTIEDNCPLPQGGSGRGWAGETSACLEDREGGDGQPGQTGGGLIWIEAQKITICEDCLIRANGGHGGAGGVGGGLTEQRDVTGGGGGAGGRGSGGGTLFLAAERLYLSGTSLLARGGNGGAGGDGGADGGAGGLGGSFHVGGEPGLPGEDGSAQGGGGGAGGPSGAAGKIYLRFEYLNDLNRQDEELVAPFGTPAPQVIVPAHLLEP